jgi:AraC-like DNA-binding protein
MIFYQQFNSSIPYNLNIREYSGCDHPLHFHGDFELLVCLEGDCSVTINGEDIILTAGDYTLVLQNEVHGFSLRSESKLFVAVFSEDYVRDFTREMDRREVNGRIVKISEDELYLSLSNISTDTPRLVACASLCYLCAKFLYSSTEVRISNVRKRTDLTHEILSYIIAHYTENIKLSDMAKSLGYEEHYLSRYFNKAFGKSFTSIVNQYRIYHARRLMDADPKRTLLGIALESGFGSLRNFNRVYLEKIGEPPRGK